MQDGRTYRELANRPEELEQPSDQSQTAAAETSAEEPVLRP